MTTESQTRSGQTGPQSDVRDELAHDAARLKDSVGERAKHEADTRKSEAVQVAGSASAALNSAADDLQGNPDAPDWMSAALKQAARQIDRLAGHVDGRSVDDLGHEIAQFARSNPSAFLAASAAAGFAAARVLRAGVDKKRHDQPGSDQARSSEQADFGGQAAQGSGRAASFTDMADNVGQHIGGVAP